MNDRPDRCTHPHCSDCATRRGHNRAIRRARHTIKTALRALRKDPS